MYTHSSLSTGPSMLPGCELRREKGLEGGRRQLEVCGAQTRLLVLPDRGARGVRRKGVGLRRPPSFLPAFEVSNGCRRQHRGLQSVGPSGGVRPGTGRGRSATGRPTPMSDWRRLCTCCLAGLASVPRVGRQQGFQGQPPAAGSRHAPPITTTPRTPPPPLLLASAAQLGCAVSLSKSGSYLGLGRALAGYGPPRAYRSKHCAL